MDRATKNALARDRTIDITTTGRKSGKLRRKEIWYRRIDDRILIAGLPGTRSWLANMLAHAEFTFHFEASVQAD